MVALGKTLKDLFPFSAPNPLLPADCGWLLYIGLTVLPLSSSESSKHHQQLSLAPFSSLLTCDQILSDALPSALAPVPTQLPFPTKSSTLGYWSKFCQSPSYPNRPLVILPLLYSPAVSHSLFLTIVWHSHTD